MRFPLVYSKRKAVPNLTQVQNDVLNSVTEEKVSSYPPLHVQTVETENKDLDLPIAIRKGTKECIKRPLYPLSHYVSLK